MFDLKCHLYLSAEEKRSKFVTKLCFLILFQYWTFIDTFLSLSL